MSAANQAQVAERCAGAGPNKSRYQPRIQSFGRIHCAVDHDLANLAMVEVNGGFVAIDAGSDPKITGTLADAWRQMAGGPLQALVYTHSHPDHIGGASGFALEGVPIFAQRQFTDEFAVTQLLPNAYYVRGAKQFGFVLPAEEVESNGIGPPLRVSTAARPTVRLPTHFVDTTHETVIGGRPFLLRAGPGETTDHLFVWLPEEKVLFAGDNLYEAFPNLYSIRGVPTRPVRQWIDTLDAMRRLRPRPELLVLGHTAPVEGADRIEQLLTDYRDAIAFVHDSVVRGINAGKTADQLACEIRLPAHLAKHPYLREQYGTVAGSVRGIWGGYMGWFDGDAANLDPITDIEAAAWVIEDMGGRAKVLARVDQALAQGQLRRALWLCRMVCASAPQARDARLAKAQVLEKLAEKCDNPLVRNWKMSEAALLRNRCTLPAKPKITGATIEAIPLEQLLGLLPSRLNPVTAAKVTMALGFDLTDTGRQFTFLIRRGVGELVAGLVGTPQLTIRATERDLKRVFMARDVPPTSLEFWRCLEFRVPGQGLFTPIRRLLELARVSRLFIKP